MVTALLLLLLLHLRLLLLVPSPTAGVGPGSFVFALPHFRVPTRWENIRYILKVDSVNF